MKAMYKSMLFGIACIFFAGCDNHVEERKMQKKIEKGFDGAIPEENIAKGFKGNNTTKELKSIEQHAKQHEEENQQSGIQEN